MKRAFFVLLFWTLFVSQAHAQQVAASCQDRPNDEALTKSLAGQWFSTGETLFGEEKYREALAAFSCSLRMIVHSATIYNAAQAAIFAGDKNMALILMKRYLVVAPEGEKAEEIKQVMAKMVLEMAPDSLQTAPAPEERPPPATPVMAPPRTPPPEPQRERKGLRPAPFIAMASVSAALGVGTIILDSSVGKQFDTADRSGRKADREDAENLQTVERVFFGLTIAAVVTTGVLAFVTNFKKEDSSHVANVDTVAPVVFENGGGLSVAGSF